MENIQIVDRTQEKIRLAKQLGLEAIKNTYQLKKEINKLTGMSFKQITHKEIKDMLVGKTNIKHFFKWGCIFSLLAGTCILIFFKASQQTSAHIIPPLAALTMGVIFYAVNNRLEIWYQELNKWRYEIPYGALLAVKEAKKKGFKNFQIAYPIKGYTYQQKCDPAIIAQPLNANEDNFNSIKWSDNWFLIFAWDDGKVYE